MNNDLRSAKPLESETPRVFPTNQPFSNFDFILKNKFSNCQSLPRILSQARQLGFQTLVDESIQCVGFAEEEDKDFKKYEKGFIVSRLRRLSFFKNHFKDLSEIQECTDSDFLGYAILKGNQFSDGTEEWNVFESVIRPSEKPNNYNHTIKSYEVLVYSKCFKILGNLYCAQNGRTNCCAHAALRSVIAATGVGDISYAEINFSLEKKGDPFERNREPKILRIEQVMKVLDDQRIHYIPDYMTKTSGGVGWTEKEYQEFMWIQSRIYKSIEVGYPVFVGFTWKEEREPVFGEEEVEGHAIAILGHTFSDDTWVPRAATQYFTVGRNVGYVSSEEWTSAYIGHDESLGSNYHIPRWYLINNPNITSIHVLATLPNELILDPIQAEGFAIRCLYKIFDQLKSTDKNPWVNRLEEAVDEQTVVLRSVFLSGEKYLDHLAKIRGWNDKKSEYIDSITIENLREKLKGMFWIIEVSLQELFPTNRRKLGEIVLKANIPIKEGDYSNFVFARLPGIFVSPEVLGELTDVITTPSKIISHTELIEVHQ